MTVLPVLGGVLVGLVLAWAWLAALRWRQDRRDRPCECLDCREAAARQAFVRGALARGSARMDRQDAADASARRRGWLP